MRRIIPGHMHVSRRLIDLAAKYGINAKGMLLVDLEDRAEYIVEIADDLHDALLNFRTEIVAAINRLSDKF
jgi:hypothetical protein